MVAACKIKKIKKKQPCFNPLNPKNLLLYLNSTVYLSRKLQKHKELTDFQLLDPTGTIPRNKI